MQISSESIKVGHPDIVADVIAEILDEEKKLGMNLENMPHCGIEVFLGKGICLVGGEVRTRAYVDIDKIAGRASEKPFSSLNDLNGRKVAKP